MYKQDISYTGIKKIYKIRKLTNKVRAVAAFVTELYRPLEKLILPNCNIKRVKNNMQLWMIDAGRSSESAVDKDTFLKLITILNSIKNPYLVRILYLYDIESLLAAVSDRISSLEEHLLEFYRGLPTIQIHEDHEYTNATMYRDSYNDRLLTVANMTYVAMASSFDMLTKFALELNTFHQKDFNTYSKRLFNGSKDTYTENIDLKDRLKQKGTLFQNPEIPRVREIVQLRSEYVHNGPWDQRPALYDACIKGKPVDSFMVMPDIDSKGILISVAGRRTFYSQSRKLNVELYKTVSEYLEIIEKTLEMIKNYIAEECIKNKGTDQTEDVIKSIQSLNMAIVKSNLLNETNSLLLGGTRTEMLLTGFMPDLQSLFKK